MNLHLVDDALFIDNSSLERFTTCPRSAKYYLEDRRESSDDRESLGFGRRIHEILDARYRYHPNVLGEETANLMQAKAAKVFADWTPADDSFRTYATALRFIEEYNTTYPVEAFSVLQLPNGKQGVEVPFAVPLCTIKVPEVVFDPSGIEDDHLCEIEKTIKVIWTGRIDLLYTREARVYIMDHKTTTMMGPSYFKEFDLSSQVYGYVWAAQKLLNVTIDGFCVNALAFRKPTKTGKAIELIRHIVPIDQHLVAEWEHDTQTIIGDLINMSVRGDYPKHTKWCVGKYGVCEYAPVCGMPTVEQREVLLQSPAYKNVEWTPLT